MTNLQDIPRFWQNSLSSIGDVLFLAQQALEAKLRRAETDLALNNPQCLRQAIGQVKAAQTWIKKAEEAQ